ncbi:MAG: biotin--[acetyl-CoA-carboxylase] ligase [Clostridiaceae bacterium]
MKDDILRYLKNNKNKYVSGQAISNELSITRACVWKYIKELEVEGYKIEGISRKGYKLLYSPDILSREEIYENLNTKYIGKNIMHFDSLGSTNVEAKLLAAKNIENGTAVIGEEQTLGRGRLGRKWISPKYKGIWMSIVLYPEVEMSEVSKITQVAAASVINALSNLGIKAEIKWPNDIVINSKKVCGILTELSGELNKINHVVVGIGINANLEQEDFPEEIKNIGTSIKIENNNEINRKVLVAYILNEFEILYEEFLNHEFLNTLKICRENSALMGKKIRVIRNGQEILGEALDIEEDGALLVKYEDGKIERIISGEVSVRGLLGYV